MAATTRHETLKEVEAITKQLNAAVTEFVSNNDNASDDWDKAQRRTVIDAAQRILDTIRRPDDRWMHMAQVTAFYTAAQMFYEWEVFEIIPIEGSISYQDLAARTNTEEALLRRTGGVLVAQGLLKQTGVDAISHTQRSLDYRRENATSHVFNMGWTNGVVAYARFSEYFKKYGRKEPQTVNHVPITFAYGRPELGFYEMMEQDPKWMNSFLKGMAHVSSEMPISGIYDFSWLVTEAEKDPNSDRAVLVDVGGGKGQAIAAIRREFPGLPIHRCVLEDLHETLEAGKALHEPELAQVQRVAVDFHRAHVYWVRRCFHNYPDEVCKNMLRILADAMTQDSKILVQEDILDNPPNQMAAFMDFMMIGFGGKQRTLENWSRLFESVGLHISSVSTGNGPWKTLAVIEVVKK
ncbi:hypothetical protein VMCG_09732 [Cytospora schulzeri]|uniref:O-methyltransferase C-terminal domain-containing protein n=1 Tax=Cytospora schulzeri TaxID=448051 RepID=A0A423VHC4_9PEZI|nr:hypothetical protein VMCG_09732 [Valsa malicola]